MAIFKNTPPIVTSGLVLSLDAANSKSYVSGSTLWRDMSGNNRSGSLNNGPTFDPTNGGSIVFDGVNDSIGLSSTLTMSGSFTWIINCKSNIMTGASNRQTYLGGLTTWFEQSDQDSLFIFNSNELSINLELPTGLIPQNTWYNAVVIRKADNTFDFYYNGIKQTLRSGDTTPISGSYNINAVGSIGSGGRYWNGNIASVQIYNRALSAAEVKQNYDALKTRFNLS